MQITCFLSIVETVIEGGKAIGGLGGLGDEFSVFARCIFIINSIGMGMSDFTERSIAGNA